MSASQKRSSGLPRRVRDHVRREELLSEGDHVVVALSGGMDSVVLLHLFRFHPPVPKLEVTAAHLDHGMRAGSAADARWVKGLTSAWDVPLVSALAKPGPSTEEEARAVRYGFLRRVAAERAATRIATAHHADDQAETVLFRIARGSGIEGLSGVHVRGPGGLVRPLLPFWRAELERYGHGAGLRWRDDPTNADPGYARNVLRNEVIPRLETGVAPGARRALARLARLATSEARAWRSLLPGLVSGVVEGSDDRRIVVARPAILAYDPAVRGRLIRELTRRLGIELDEAGTKVAAGFVATGASGKSVDLAGGLTLRRDFDRFVLGTRDSSGEWEHPSGKDALSIGDTGPGFGTLRLGGRRLDVRWYPGRREEGPGSATFPVGPLAFPLLLRGWHAGDRIRLDYGVKKLKKLFAEARIPARDRWTRPILVDSGGEVLWVPGLARSTKFRSDAPGESLTLGIENARED